MRLNKEQLQEVMKKHGVDRIWSWSKFHCFETSPYEYFLKYIKKIKEDKADSIYVSTGGMSHEILERYYTGVIGYDRMIKEFEDCWMTCFDIGELKFNRSDDEKNSSIAQKYYANMKHFFENHVPLTYSPVIEEFCDVEIGKHLFQGYIDCYFTDNDSNVHIVDFKTSSIYKGEKALNECGQLVVYAIGMTQRGIPLDKIKICWNFLKYVNVICEKPDYYKVEWETAKGESKLKEKLDEAKLVSTLKASIKAWLKAEGYTKTEIDEYITQLEDSGDFTVIPESVTKHFSIEKLDLENKPRQIERCNIGQALTADCKKQMKRLGYTKEEIEENVEIMQQTNSIEFLPEDVKNKYQFSDCYVYVDLTEEFVNEWKTKIIDTLEDIEYRESEYAKDKNENWFFDSIESVEKQSFYFNNLCGYSANLHKPYAKYLEALKEAEEQKDNLFSELGIETEESVSNKATKNNLDNDIDLSWIDEL